MEYLREQPVTHMVERIAFADTYVADIMQPRPSFDDIANSAPTWATAALRQMQEAMERKNSPITWVQVVFDQTGMLLLLRVADPQHLGNIKSAAKSILKCLPSAQRQAVQDSLRPLDEVDRNRIAAWQTLASMRPAGQKRRADHEEGQAKRARTADYSQTMAEREKAAQSCAKSAAQLVAEESDSDTPEEFVPLRLTLSDALAAPANDPDEYQRRMLTDTQEAQPLAIPAAIPSILDPASGWEHTAKHLAAIVAVEVGVRPARLAYTHCHREGRRHLLLRSKLSKGCGMTQTVFLAMRLVIDGSLPPLGERGRKVEFIRRCAGALRSLDPSKETDLKRLSVQDQALVRQALGGDTSTSYEGCLSETCLDEETTWEATDMKMSRCDRCHCPKAFGRTVHSIRDIILPRMTREFGRVSQLSAGH